MELSPESEPLGYPSEPWISNHTTSIDIYPSAIAIFYSPSDIFAVNGICKERIRCVTKWRQGPARHDTVLVRAPGITTMSGFTVARVRLFFKLEYGGVSHSCALIHDYTTCGEEPDEDTGIWIVRRAFHGTRRPQARVICISDILRAAHLIPVFSGAPIPDNLKHTECLDHPGFHKFYVNRFVDHHAFEILS